MKLARFWQKSVSSRVVLPSSQQIIWMGTNNRSTWDLHACDDVLHHEHIAREHKKRTPKHQNSFAFRHNPKSKKTESILSMPVYGILKSATNRSSGVRSTASANHWHSQDLGVLPNEYPYSLCIQPLYAANGQSEWKVLFIDADNAIFVVLCLSIAISFVARKTWRLLIILHVTLVPKGGYMHLYIVAVLFGSGWASFTVY